MRRRILILVHPATVRAEVARWAIDSLTKIWSQQGLQVGYVLGTAKAHPADVLIVHVDLSVVPERYLDFARS